MTEVPFEWLVSGALVLFVAMAVLMIWKPELYIRKGYGFFLDLKEKQSEETLFYHRGMGLLFLLISLAMSYMWLTGRR
jgi:hypothetical protein